MEKALIFFRVFPNIDPDELDDTIQDFIDDFTKSLLSNKSDEDFLIRDIKITSNHKGMITAILLYSIIKS